MKQSNHKAAERLANALQNAFSERRRMEIDPRKFRTAGIMAEIRRIGPLNGPNDFWSVFEKMAWKFIPAAVALVLFLGVAFTQIESADNDIVADIYNETNFESGLYAFYNR